MLAFASMTHVGKGRPVYDCWRKLHRFESVSSPTRYVAPPRLWRHSWRQRAVRATGDFYEDTPFKLPASGVYTFTVYANMMADGAFGRFVK